MFSSGEKEGRERELEAYWKAQRNTEGETSNKNCSDHRSSIRNTCSQPPRQERNIRKTHPSFILATCFFCLGEIRESLSLPKNKADRRGSKTFKMFNSLKIVSARQPVFPKSRSLKPIWSSYLQHVFSVAKKDWGMFRNCQLFIEYVPNDTLLWLLRLLFPFVTNPTGTSPCMLSCCTGGPRVDRNVRYHSLLFYLKIPPLKISFVSALWL